MTRVNDPGQYWLEAGWPLGTLVRAGTTTRAGGVSMAPYAGCNLALHVGDEHACVSANRARVRSMLATPDEPYWLTQCHGNRVVDWSDPDTRADGSYASRAGVVLAVLTADCVPIVLTQCQGRELAVLHAGWRGLAAGIIEAGIARFAAAPATLRAWIGPAICADCYEVGAEVRSALLAHAPALASVFAATRPGHFRLDLSAATRLLLARAGVSGIYGGDHCTRHEAARWYSHRRDGTTGRMATLAWLAGTQT